MKFQELLKLPKKALLSIIKQKPIKINSKDDVCPFCKEKNAFEVRTQRSTLLAGKPDPNHYWSWGRCKSCNFRYTREHKCDNVWFTKSILNEDVDPLVLAGVSNCHESYTYNCKECDGHVVRIFTNLKGDAVNSLSFRYENGKPIPEFHTFWYCVNCHKGVCGDR
jgi:hypothetical protein